MPALIAATSSEVELSGRRRTISRAIAPAWRSSPKRRRTLAIRDSGHSLTRSAAEKGWAGSIRMSSGAS